MRKDFFISIESRQSVDGQVETTKVFAPCTYALKDGLARIAYEEEHDGQKILSCITVGEADKVIISRKGAFTTELTLETGKRHTCTYATEFGTLEIGVLASEIMQDLADDGGQVTLKYSLDVGGRPLIDNKVAITVKEKIDV